MRLYVGIAMGLLLGVGMTLFVLRGTPQVVYAGGMPSGNGDVNGDGRIDIADGIYIINYQLRHGPAPVPIELPPCPPPSLPATGQTQCYDTGGNVIDCASADWPGQDGFYGKGCPTADRYVDNQDGTVTDTCTGLMWQKETADVSGNGSVGDEDNLPWQNALQYCETLDFVGHSDWRLPNVGELQSIVDYGRSYPSSDPIFGAESGWYWSSSTYVVYPSLAWYIYFGDGGVYGGGKGNGYYVRAVRG
jgi:hypothetical protein